MCPSDKNGDSNRYHLIHHDVEKGGHINTRSSSAGCKVAKKASSTADFASEDMPFMDDTGTSSPTDQSGPAKCNLCSSGAVCSDCSKNSQAGSSRERKPTDSTNEASKPDDHVQISNDSVWKKATSDQTNATWKPTLNAANQRLIHDIERGHLVTEWDSQSNPNKWSPQLNSNNKGSAERTFQAKERVDGKDKEESSVSEKEYKVPLVNEDYDGGL